MDEHKSLHHALKSRAQSLYGQIEQKRHRARELTVEADALAEQHSYLLDLLDKHAPKAGE
jgi:hypothetical protein